MVLRYELAKRNKNERSGRVSCMRINGYLALEGWWSSGCVDAPVGWAVERGGRYSGGGIGMAVSREEEPDVVAVVVETYLFFPVLAHGGGT